MYNLNLNFKKTKLALAVLSFFVFFDTYCQDDGSRTKHFLLFWRSDCGACALGIQQLVTLCATLDKSTYKMTTISFDTDSTAYFNALQAHKMLLFDNQYNFEAGYWDNLLARRYGVKKTPTLLYVDKTGKVLAEGQVAFKILKSLKKSEPR